MGAEFCQRLFLHLLRLSYDFYLSICWYITLIDLHILKNPCIPGINPTWSWCMSFLMCCCILFAKIFLRIFASMFITVHQWYWPVVFFCHWFSFLFCFLCLVLVSGWWWPPRMNLEVFLPQQYFERALRRISISFSLNFW